MTAICTTPMCPEFVAEPAAGTGGEDSRLLAGLRRRDESSCEQFVREFGTRVYAVALRFLKCQHEAADATQETFVSAFKALDAFEGQSRLSTWLHRIVVNVCLMKIRSRNNRRETPIDELLPSFDHDGRHSPGAGAWRDGMDDPLVAQELRQHVRSSIDRLPESYRTVLLLRDIEGLDTKETARLLDCSTTNVKVRLHRARQALKSMLDPIFCEPDSPPAANPFRR